MGSTILSLLRAIKVKSYTLNTLFIKKLGNMVDMSHTIFVVPQIGGYLRNEGIQVTFPVFYSSACVFTHYSTNGI